MLFSCSTNHQINCASPGVGEQWRISDTIANRMIARLHQCGLFKPCHDNSKITDPNNAEYQWLVSNYGRANITHVDARYRRKDQDRYRELRCITDEKKWKVRGYKTQLVKVTMVTGSMYETTNYYDIYSLKPPPEEN